MKRVAVIGAGAAGLCCARHLSRFPETFQFTVFEQSAHVGGVWVYNNPTPGLMPSDVREVLKSCDPSEIPYHSTMYRNLRTNLPKEIMLFPGFPFADHLRSFIGHTDVRAYLEEYAEHYGLNRYIKFGKQVEQVSPVPQKQATLDHPFDSIAWTVTTKSLETGQKVSEEFDLILVCNGHFFTPCVPEFKGLSSFPRPVLHSCWYKEPEPFKDKTILVIGAGPSGLDLMVDLSAHAQKVCISNRRGSVKSKVPDNVEKLPGISEFTEDGRVCFENGEERIVDCVILATGYLYSYPFLSEESGIKIVEGKRVTHLYKHTFNVAHPSLAIVGINSGFIPFPTFDLQVQWILAVWCDKKILPSKQEMIGNAEEVYQSRLKEGLFPDRAGHYLGDKRWEFNDELVKLGGTKPLFPLMRPLFETVHKHRSSDVFSYRDINFSVTSDEEFSYTN